MFETSQQINQRLYRAILNGRQYEKDIPISRCKPMVGGKGNTEHSVKQMAKVVELYSHQTKKLAQKLKKSSLIQTCQQVQDFLYWHFQYKRDEQDQILRSPACSFAQRFEGIDCKSYSILAASILRELGIANYFRRVSYDKNLPYSHVYVVVPKNQKTADLSQGYYTIDGTLNKNTETENYFYKNNDYLVMKLNHYILNAPHRGLGEGEDDFWAELWDKYGDKVLKEAERVFGRIIIKGPTDITKWISDARHQCASFMVPFINKINKAIYEKDLDKITELYNDFAEAQAILFDYAYSWGKHHPPCNNTLHRNNSDGAEGKMNREGIAYTRMFENSYEPWFMYYFQREPEQITIAPKTNKQYGNPNLEVSEYREMIKKRTLRLLNKYAPGVDHLDGSHFLGYNHKLCHGIGYRIIKPGTLRFKSGVNEFKPFVFSQEVLDTFKAKKEEATKKSGQEIVNSLVDIVSLVGKPNNNGYNQQPQNNNGYNQQPQNNNGGGNNFPNQPAAGSKQAGITGILAAVLLTAGIGYMIMNSKKSKTKK